MFMLLILGHYFARHLIDNNPSVTPSFAAQPIGASCFHATTVPAVFVSVEDDFPRAQRTLGKDNLVEWRRSEERIGIVRNLKEIGRGAMSVLNGFAQQVKDV